MMSCRFLAKNKTTVSQNNKTKFRIALLEWKFDKISMEIQKIHSNDIKMKSHNNEVQPIKSTDPTYSMCQVMLWIWIIVQVSVTNLEWKF